MHYRGASSSGRRAARAAVTSVVGRDAGLHVMSGKQVWEIVSVDGPSKSRALRWILRAEAWPLAGADARAIYVGDDVTDEVAFRDWAGLSIVVGRRERTAARYYVRSPGEVHAFLERLERLQSCARRQIRLRS